MQHYSRATPHSKLIRLKTIWPWLDFGFRLDFGHFNPEDQRRAVIRRAEFQVKLEKVRIGVTQTHRFETCQGFGTENVFCLFALLPCLLPSDSAVPFLSFTLMQFYFMDGIFFYLVRLSPLSLYLIASLSLTLPLSV